MAIETLPRVEDATAPGAAGRQAIGHARGADLGATLARLGAILAAAERLAAELEDEVSADAFAQVTALQCVVAEGRAQVRIAELALSGAAA